MWTKSVNTQRCYSGHLRKTLQNSTTTTTLAKKKKKLAQLIKTYLTSNYQFKMYFGGVPAEICANKGNLTLVLYILNAFEIKKNKVCINTFIE